MKILTERLLIRNLCEADYPEFERSLNDVQKSYFGMRGILNGEYLANRIGAKIR